MRRRGLLLVFSLRALLPSSQPLPPSPHPSRFRPCSCKEYVGKFFATFTPVISDFGHVPVMRDKDGIEEADCKPRSLPSRTRFSSLVLAPFPYPFPPSAALCFAAGSCKVSCALRKPSRQALAMTPEDVERATSVCEHFLNHISVAAILARVAWFYAKRPTAAPATAVLQ